MAFSRYQNILLMFKMQAPVTRGPLNVCVWSKPDTCNRFRKIMTKGMVTRPGNFTLLNYTTRKDDFLLFPYLVLDTASSIDKCHFGDILRYTSMQSDIKMFLTVILIMDILCTHT